MTKRAIRSFETKLIETLRPDIYGNDTGYMELYNLKGPMGESRNLISENKDLAGKLMLEMESWYRKRLAGEPDPLDVQPISLPIPL